MQIKQLDITAYDENTEYDPGRLVFQVMGEEGCQYQIHYPFPMRGRDAEIDLDDGQIPCMMFCAMLGRKVAEEEVIGKFFEVILPEGVYNG